MTQMTCGPLAADTHRCRTKWELFRQIVGLLPRGRAWQTHEDLAEAVIAAATAEAGAGAFGVMSVGTAHRTPVLTRQQQVWAAFAEVLEVLHQRACALLDEMFCATQTETRGEWGYDFGFPDACEPWDTLCAKVVATGGANCAYLTGLAARIGYAIECRDTPCRAVADCAVADCTPVGEPETAPRRLYIRILAAQSPAYMVQTPFSADAAVADCTPPCAVPPDAVVCLIERFKPADVAAIYEVVQ